MCVNKKLKKWKKKEWGKELERRVRIFFFWNEKMKERKVWEKRKKVGQRERKNCETCINKRKRNEKGEMVKKIQIKDTSHKIKIG